MIIDDLLRDMPMFRDDLERELRAVIDAVGTVRSQGELNIKFKFAPKGTAGRIDVTPIVAGKPPKDPPIEGVFFLTPEGNLSKRDHRQIDLEDVLKERQK